MRRFFCGIFILLCTQPALGLSAGFRLFFPENGGISFETSVAGEKPLFGETLSLPYGIRIYEISGFSAGEDFESTPWLYSDSLQIFTGLKSKVDFGDSPFYIKLSALAFLHYDADLRVYNDRLSGDLCRLLEYELLSGNFHAAARPGFGAETALGFGFRQMRFGADIDIGYLYGSSPITLTGDYLYFDGASAGSGSYRSSENLWTELSGITVGIDFFIVL